MDIRRYNAEAWDAEVRGGNQWTRPVGPQEISAAREGRWSIKLIPTLAVPADWFPPLPGCRVLCLASGGGQQAPVLAAAGATVTVLDNSPAQLEQDRYVAEREDLDLEIVAGDMADLSRFADGRFDLIVHPVSNCFVPDVQPVWRESWRVLADGGVLLAGHMNPAFYMFDHRQYRQGKLIVRHTLPYADPTSLDPAELAAHEADAQPYEFSHTLETLIGGQLAAGFVLTGFYEDRFTAEALDPLSRHMATLLATRAVKRAAVGDG